MNFTVLGKRVLIQKPESIESAVLLTDDVKAQLDKDLIAKWTKLRVAAVGNECTTIKADDMVYVGRVLEHAEVILIEDVTYFMINEAQISIVW